MTVLAAYLCVALSASDSIEPELEPESDKMVKYWLRSGVEAGGLLCEYWTSAVPSHADPRLQVCARSYVGRSDPGT